MNRRQDWLSIKSADWSVIDLSHDNKRLADEMPTLDLKELFHWAKQESERGILMSKKEFIGPDQLFLLAKKHIQRYENLIKFEKCGFANVRIDECAYYLGIWQSILIKGCYECLNLEEQCEVMDAVEDEKL